MQDIFTMERKRIVPNMRPDDESRGPARRAGFSLFNSVEPRLVRLADKVVMPAEISRQHLIQLLALSCDCIYARDRAGRWLLANPACCELLGLEPGSILGRADLDRIIARRGDLRVAQALRLADEKAWQAKKLCLEQQRFVLEQGREISFDVVRLPVFDEQGRAVLILVVARATGGGSASGAGEEVAGCRCAELRQLLGRREEELDRQSDALDLILQRIEKIQKEFEGRMMDELRERITPLVNRLRPVLPPGEQVVLEQILAQLEVSRVHLPSRIRADQLGLTPREMELAEFVVQGLRNKEIAERLGISLRSVESHRYNLRRKLGLIHSRKNLRAFLLSVLSS